MEFNAVEVRVCRDITRRKNIRCAVIEINGSNPEGDEPGKAASRRKKAGPGDEYNLEEGLAREEEKVRLAERGTNEPGAGDKRAEEKEDRRKRRLGKL